MRVALLVTDLQRGGTPLRLARLARGLRASGVEVVVGCLSEAGPISADLAAEGIVTFACNARSARDFGVFTRLHRELARLQPDLIHATLTHANVAARWAAWKLGIPVITSTATIEVERKWHPWIERWTCGRDAAHVVNSAAVASYVRDRMRIPGNRVHQIPLLPPERRPRVSRYQARADFGLADQTFAVAWAGRLDPVKGLDVILQAAKLLAGLDIHVLLAGEGPQRPALERAIADSSTLARTVRLLGWQADLTPLLCAADAFVFPSRTEGMPNAVIDAMALGVPIVASDIPAHRELSEPGRSFILAPVDDPRAFAAGLRLLIDNPRLRGDLGNAAAQWIASLDATATVRELIRIYSQVLSEWQQKRL